MSDRTAIFWAKVNVVIGGFAVGAALAGCFLFRRTMVFTFAGMLLGWVSALLSLGQSRRLLRKTQKRLVEALQENLALKEGNLRIRIGDPGDHDQKGIVT
jgi:hypothetical protein